MKIHKQVLKDYIKLYTLEEDVKDYYKFKVELNLQKAIDDKDKTEWVVSVGGRGYLSTEDATELNFLMAEGIKIAKDLNKKLLK